MRVVLDCNVLVSPAMVEALERIEDMRALHVRGNADGGERATDAKPLGLTSPDLGHVSLST